MDLRCVGPADRLPSDRSKRAEPRGVWTFGPRNRETVRPHIKKEVSSQNLHPLPTENTGPGRRVDRATPYPSDYDSHVDPGGSGDHTLTLVKSEVFTQTEDPLRAA